MSETNSPSASLSAAVASPHHSLESLQRLLGQLRARYKRAEDGIIINEVTSSAVEERLDSLTLAEAVLRGVTNPTPLSDRLKQIAAIGPTQAGKSTVVNLLLGVDAALVSPLAAFTQHPQAFAVDLEDESIALLSTVLAGWKQIAPTARRPGSHNYYSVTHLSDVPGSVLGPCVVWDTTDFDSAGSRNYRRSVLEIAALSDVLVLVLSKEKYADQSVWSLVRLLRPLACPTLVCLNKVSVQTEAIVKRSLQQKLAQRQAAASEEIITLPYDSVLEERSAEELSSGVAKLRAAARRLLDAERTPRIAGARALLTEHWDRWVAPVTAEHAAREKWERHVHAATNEALTAYCRDYLEHPQRYDALRLMVVQLLELLELPGVSKAAARVRRTITWPARRLWQAGRGFVVRPTAADTKARPPGNESLVLEEILLNMLTRLTRDVVRWSGNANAEVAFWRALGRALIAEQTTLQEEFRDAIRDHHQGFQPQIEAAAQQWYQALRDKPTVLNSLRAARATTDTAGVVLALKTGGIGVNDLLLTPAMLAVTSMLTEGAVGQYLSRVVNELRRKQREAVEQGLLARFIQPRLERIGHNLDDEALFNVSAESLATAVQTLASWPHE